MCLLFSINPSLLLLLLLARFTVIHKVLVDRKPLIFFLFQIIITRTRPRPTSLLLAHAQVHDQLFSLSNSHEPSLDSKCAYIHGCTYVCIHRCSSKPAERERERERKKDTAASSLLISNTDPTRRNLDFFFLLGWIPREEAELCVLLHRRLIMHLPCLTARFDPVE